MTPLKLTGIEIPKVIFGTSAFGNLYQETSGTTKTAIIEQLLKHTPGKIVLDTAGKYGAGLAIESIAETLTDLRVPQDRVVISNKLGWRRVPLKTDEPTFEPGVWFGLENDAVQDISYDGILRCWEQGNRLLGGYEVQLVSVHDPDEYLAAAKNEEDRESRWDDLIDAYRALDELRDNELTQGIGVGSKDWRVARDLAKICDLDWVMLANSYTIYQHEPELIDFVDSLHKRGIVVINSAIFHGGFLVGSEYFDYHAVSRESNGSLFEWRDRFNAICERCSVLPANACAAFALSHPGVASIALNTSQPNQVVPNLNLPNIDIDNRFWLDLKDQGLIREDYPHLGLDAGTG